MAKFDVDYPHVRENADIVAVLEHYDVTLVGQGEQRKGLCPLHESEHPSLSVNVRKNQFKCHSCGSGGNVIRLVQLLDTELQNPRRAALKIAQLSGIPAKPNGKVAKPKPVAKPERLTLEESSAADTGGEATSENGREYNRPLTFELQLSPVLGGEDTPGNQFVAEHGLCCDRLFELGAGMALRGSMKDRLAIPIRNCDGEINAYCGCHVGLLGEDEPAFKLPPKFRSDLELFGWDVAQYFDRVVLVDGILPVVRYGGAASTYGDTGFGVASIMGARISDRQLELLSETAGEIILVFNDELVSRKAALEIAGRIASTGVWVRLSDSGEEPLENDIDVFCRAFGRDESRHQLGRP